MSYQLPAMNDGCPLPCPLPWPALKLKLWLNNTSRRSMKPQETLKEGQKGEKTQEERTVCHLPIALSLFRLCNRSSHYTICPPLNGIVSCWEVSEHVLEEDIHNRHHKASILIDKCFIFQLNCCYHNAI